MTDTVDYASRVAKGIALLDDKWPAWATEIDLDRLNIADGQACMTAQYAQKHGHGAYWWQAIEPLGLENEDEDYSGHGFNASEDEQFSDDDPLGTLNRLWKDEILARRARVQQAPTGPEETS